MSKKQKIKKENLNPTYDYISKKLKPEEVFDCKEIINNVNDVLKKRNESKFNNLNHCDSEHKRCNCGDDSGNSKNQATDLIILIDTSGSMRTSAKAVSDAVTEAIKAAEKNCEPDLRLIFLGVDGTWSGTKFTQSHRKYINGLHGTGVTLAADKDNVGLKSEQGANAIEDLSKFADWRKGACRAIFYISDEELDSISPRNDFANETAVTNAAIAAANANKVTIFAHHLTYQNLAPQIIQNYKDLCEDTGGKVYFSKAPDKKEYVRLLTEIICNACGISSCKEIEIPKITPCISVKWGDSECDCLESSDFEVMTLTVCNCYSNIKFQNFKIASIEIFDASGKPVPVLPNGTPSIKLHPIGVYCFGDIEPCSCITREFVLISEGAKDGKYKLRIKGICFDVSISNNVESECFEFTICKD